MDILKFTKSKCPVFGKAIIRILKAGLALIPKSQRERGQSGRHPSRFIRRIVRCVTQAQSVNACGAVGRRRKQPFNVGDMKGRTQIVGEIGGRSFPFMVSRVNIVNDWGGWTKTSVNALLSMKKPSGVCGYRYGCGCAAVYVCVCVSVCVLRCVV